MSVCVHTHVLYTCMCECAYWLLCPLIKLCFTLVNGNSTELNVNWRGYSHRQALGQAHTLTWINSPSPTYYLTNAHPFHSKMKLSESFQQRATFVSVLTHPKSAECEPLSASCQCALDISDSHIKVINQGHPSPRYNSCNWLSVNCTTQAFHDGFIVFFHIVW